jgi:hypothetical protein
MLFHVVLFFCWCSHLQTSRCEILLLSLLLAASGGVLILKFMHTVKILYAFNVFSKKKYFSKRDLYYFKYHVLWYPLHVLTKSSGREKPHCSMSITSSPWHRGRTDSSFKVEPTLHYAGSTREIVGEYNWFDLVLAFGARCRTARQVSSRWSPTCLCTCISSCNARHVVALLKRLFCRCCFAPFTCLGWCPWIEK